MSPALQRRCRLLGLPVHDDELLAWCLAEVRRQQVQGLAPWRL